LDFAAEAVFSITAILLVRPTILFRARKPPLRHGDAHRRDRSYKNGYKTRAVPMIDR